MVGILNPEPRDGDLMETQTLYITRGDDVSYIMECIAALECCSIVGVSNIGKSTLLRSLYLPLVREQYLAPKSDEYLFIYVDFNLMVEMTEQAFYELILRTTLAELNSERSLLKVSETLLSQVNRSYQNIVNPANPFAVPLSFNEGIIAISEGLDQRVIFLFDEFDEPFSAIEGRVFLNLRALKDKYHRRLCYVVATGQRLRQIRRSPEIDEFCELFAHHVRFLGPLPQDDIRHIVNQFARQEGLDFSPQDVDFIIAQAGGHPGLLAVVCRVVGAAIKSGEYQFYGDRRYEHIREQLDDELNVRTECAKLWNNLTAEEQAGLIAYLSRPDASQDELRNRSLQQKAILIEEQGGKRSVFGRLFEGFAWRQRLVREGGRQGVWIDVEAGEVWVDGRSISTLTNLEYRLLLLLYGNLDKICDKYKIVEAVWAENYIDEVEDSRIEKLISRLRQKIEPDPAEPRYIQTVRGRGYKLVSAL